MCGYLCVDTHHNIIFEKLHKNMCVTLAYNICSFFTERILDGITGRVSGASSGVTF